MENKILVLARSMVLSFCGLFLTMCDNNPVKEDCSLWTIQDNKGNISYLLGTVHVFPRGKIKLNSSINKILLECDNLVLERDLNAKMENSIREKVQRDPLMRDYFVLNRVFGDRLVNMEGELIKKINDGTKLIGLETADNLANTIHKINIDKPYLNDQDILEFNLALIDDYNNCNLKQIVVKMTDRYGEDLRNKLIFERNQEWIHKLDSLMATKEINFFAVGASHLPTDKGLISLLTNKGYVLTPLNEDQN